MVLKAGAAKIRVLLPVLGFVCFLVFQFLKSDDDSVTDVNTFLRTRLLKLVDAFDENKDGVLDNEEVSCFYGGKKQVRGCSEYVGNDT